MKAGPKGAIKAAPLDFTGWPKDRAARRIRFIKEYIITPSGVGEAKPMVLREFQKEIIRGSFATGVRDSLISIPRGNGKTALAAALAVAELFVGPRSAEALIVASDQRQANITLRFAKQMIQLHPELAERAHVYGDRIVVPENGDALLQPLPADPDALHGWNPSLMVIDELHVVTELVWEAVTSVSGKRPESLTLAISTPGHNSDSVMWRMVVEGRKGGDPMSYFKEYAAPAGCDLDDREAWRIANPAMSCKNPFLTEDGLASNLKKLREPVFRQLRLGQWVEGTNSWLPWGAWDSVTAASAGSGISAGQRVVFAFDGSVSRDSTALIGCTLDGHLFVEGLWERPANVPDWRVPREEVNNAVDAAFDRYDVIELACDPWAWQTDIEQWAKKHGEKRVLHWDTSQAVRMAPATDRMYQAVMEKAITHDGNPRLAAHISNCVAEQTNKGTVVRKDKKNSPKKIDAAVAAIAAYDRAKWHESKSKKKRVYYSND
ncbi:terminase large subunit [Nocardia uniformis]|uniref:Terminase large subunit n=1 Tax=Nocardia uniformis TaxID=53432 RepID=A0A849BZW2_9NOCA|nr:terminase large subunit [Nocardia uniformis]NNH69177.1 terminase large subunit [Nocardia uniformis]